MFSDLRDFIQALEKAGELKRISAEVDPHLELTEICDRTLKKKGPALLFENPKGYSIPVLGNLFGTPKRVAMAMGQEDVESLRDVGKLLAFLKEPEPPAGWKDLLEKHPSSKMPFILTLRKSVNRPARKLSLKKMMLIRTNCQYRPAGQAMPAHWSPGPSSSPGVPTKNVRISASTGCSYWAETSSSCAGLPIAAARLISGNGKKRIRVTPFLYPLRLVQTRDDTGYSYPCARYTIRVCLCRTAKIRQNRGHQVADE